MISLVFGVIFAGFTTVWLLELTGAIDDDQVWLVGPVVLIVAGAAGLVAALRPRSRSDEESSDDPEVSLR